MPDITMCSNEKCADFKKCYRAQAKPNPYRQSYAEFKPEIRFGGQVCENFIAIHKEKNDE